MTSTNTAAEITISKGTGRYEISVNGVDAAWAYKNANGTWSVRTKRTTAETFNQNNEVVAGSATRTDALANFSRWLSDEPFFLSFRQEWIEKDAREAADLDLMMNDYDAWLAAR